MLSASHLIILFLVALLVFGPEKLPELARTLSKTMMEFRRITGEFQDTLQREMRQLEREALEQSRPKPEPPLATAPAALADPETPGPVDALTTPADAEDFDPYPGGAPAKRASGEWPPASLEAEPSRFPDASPAGETPAANSPETLSLPAEEKTAVTAAAENPLNDHHTAA